MTLVENEEFGELEISDFVEPTVSAFAELLNEHEKMKVWWGISLFHYLLTGNIHKSRRIN